MASRDINLLHPKLIPLCLLFLSTCRAADIDIFLTCTYRSNEEQDADYAKGRTTPGNIVTNAKGGESMHNFTLPDGTPASKAFDFAIKNRDGSVDWNASDPAWHKAIAIGIDLGLTSGSQWKSLKDNPHFELKE